MIGKRLINIGLAILLVSSIAILTLIGLGKLPVVYVLLELPIALTGWLKRIFRKA